MNATRFRTPVGMTTLLWEQRGRRPVVVRIQLPRLNCAAGRKKPGKSAAPAACAEITRLARTIAAELAGRKTRPPLQLLALTALPAFHQAVLRAARRIPRGQVRTYGQIATQLGKPGAARAVGNALAANPFPLAIPCHRVVRAGGRLGGFGGGHALKRALLAREGVYFDPTGRRRLA